MTTPIHQNHAANVVAKTVRWVEALEKLDALMVPEILNELTETGPAGAILAADAWDRLAETVTMVTGRTEVRPDSTRKAIAVMARDRRVALNWTGKAS